MNNDNFTEVARAEAERRHIPLDRPTAITEQCAVQGFQDGAEWARTHLAAQEPTDAEVEAGKAVLESRASVFDGHLPGFSEHVARKVLIAARAARRDEKDTP